MTLFLDWVQSHLQTQRFRWFALAVLASSMTTLAILSRPAQAYQVQFIPNNPQLGDTLAVVIQAEADSAPPIVTVLDKTYPTFPISGPNSDSQFRALVPTSPVNAPGRLNVQITGEDGTSNVAVNLRNRSFPTQRITLSPGRAGLEGTDYEFDRLDALKAMVTPEKYWDGPMARPSNGRVSSIYGLRRYYNGVFAENYYHRGVDYAQGNGAPIYAPAAGRIELVGRVEDGFQLNGNTLGINHGQGVISVMIHLSGFDVQEGDFVQAGQLIGRMGSTGFATGPNLHWGLYVNEVSVDPVPWRYDGVG
ncbi:MAG: M23 family metallopeptidase [Cyanobacteria bacterium P01_A01_bin.114]